MAVAAVCKGGLRCSQRQVCAVENVSEETGFLMNGLKARLHIAVENVSEETSFLVNGLKAQLHIAQGRVA